MLLTRTGFSRPLTYNTNVAVTDAGTVLMGFIGWPELSLIADCNRFLDRLTSLRSWPSLQNTEFPVTAGFVIVNSYCTLRGMSLTGDRGGELV